MASEISIDQRQLGDVCLTVLQATGCDIAFIGDNGRVISSSKTGLVGRDFLGIETISNTGQEIYEISGDMATTSEDMHEGCLVKISSSYPGVSFLAVISPLQIAKQYLQIVREFAALKLNSLCSDSDSSGAISVSEDTSFSKNADKNGLELSEARFRDFASAAADWFWEMGPDLRFTFLSGRVEEVLGVKPEHLIGKTREEIHGGATYTTKPEWRAHIEAIERHEPFTNFVTCWIKPDGSECFYLISGNPIFDKYGGFQGYRGAGTDITKRRSIERRVAFTQFTVDQAKIAIFWCYSNGTFFYVNNTACEWLQYTRDELSQMHVADINPEFPTEAWPEHWQEIKDKGLVYLESVHQRKNGEIYPVGIYSNYVQFEGDEYKLAFVHDLTERKVSEAKANKANAILNGVLDAASQVSIICTDKEGIITVFNSGAEKMLGYSADEMIYKQTPVTIHLKEEIEKRSAELTSKYGRRIEGFDTFVTEAIEYGYEEREWTYVKKDGAHIQVYLGVTAIYDENECIGYLGTAIDITDRKHSEAELRKSTQILNDVLNTIPVRVFWKDVEGVYLGCNKLFAMDAGKELPADLIGLNDYDLSWKDNADDYRRDDWQVISSRQEKINYEEKQTTPDGNSVWLSTSKVPLLNEDGDVYGVLGTYDDITDRKLSEITLKRLQSYLSNIIDSMPSLLIGVDAEGMITQWNNEAMLQTGLTVGDAVGKPLAEVLPRLEDELHKVRSVIKSGKAIMDLKRPYKANDQVRYEDITVFPLVSEGLEIEGAVIMIEDVTEQVALEEMMIQSEKMLSVGGLAAGMAHEINNPLAGMIQTANVMKNRLADNSIKSNSSAAEKYGVTMTQIEDFMQERGIMRMIDDINVAGTRVAEIVNNMLNFARKSDAAVSSHNLNDLIDTTINLAAADYNLKSHYDFKAIEIIKDYDETIPPVPCESGKIQQVLLNVFRNGAEAMHSHSGIQPKFEIATWYDQEHSCVCVEIEDNGPGMEEEARKRAFEPFYTTKPVGVGTGLGLSVSYFIITENHDGEMKVESEPGNGAKFTICLPISNNGDSV